VEKSLGGEKGALRA